MKVGLARSRSHQASKSQARKREQLSPVACQFSSVGQRVPLGQVHCPIGKCRRKTSCNISWSETCFIIFSSSHSSNEEGWEKLLPRTTSRLKVNTKVAPEGCSSAMQLMSWGKRSLVQSPASHRKGSQIEYASKYFSHVAGGHSCQDRASYVQVRGCNSVAEHLLVRWKSSGYV